jgi:hypothetical protein
MLTTTFSGAGRRAAPTPPVLRPAAHRRPGSPRRFAGLARSLSAHRRCQTCATKAPQPPWWPLMAPSTAEVGTAKPTPARMADGCRNAHYPLAIDQGAAGVAGADRRVGLHQVLSRVLARSAGAPEGVDHSRRNRPAEPVGAADRDHKRPNAQRRRRDPGDRRPAGQYPQYGDTTEGSASSTTAGSGVRPAGRSKSSQARRRPARSLVITRPCE